MGRVNCYLVRVDECGQIDSADLVHSQMVDKVKTSEPKIDFLIKKFHKASLHSVYMKNHPDKRSFDISADCLRFYKIS